MSFFYKRKGYSVDQKLDVIEKNRGHFRIQRPNGSQKQVPDLSQQKLCSPVLSTLVIGRPDYISLQRCPHKPVSRTCSPEEFDVEYQTFQSATTAFTSSLISELSFCKFRHCWN